jgi:hypothetical protein
VIEWSRIGWVRGILVVLGLGVMGFGIVRAVGPFHDVREFRAVVDCDRRTDCFGREPGTIVARRTYTTSTTDSDGHTTTTTHYEVTWERGDGRRDTRDVSRKFYGVAHEGTPVELRTWRDAVIGLDVGGREQWFLPSVGYAFGGWLFLAAMGFGVMVWGLFFGFWDGWFHLFFRLFSYMFFLMVVLGATVVVLAYGFASGWELVRNVVGFLFAFGIASAMLLGSLDDGY